jgi:hypothetical protein
MLLGSTIHAFKFWRVLLLPCLSQGYDSERLLLTLYCLATTISSGRVANLAQSVGYKKKGERDLNLSDL